jgi:hypothetical protein
MFHCSLGKLQKEQSNAICPTVYWESFIRNKAMQYVPLFTGKASKGTKQCNMFHCLLGKLQKEQSNAVHVLGNSKALCKHFELLAYSLYFLKHTRFCACNISQLIVLYFLDHQWSKENVPTLLFA